jgi:hypothetical protein
MAAVLVGMKVLHAEPPSRGDSCRGDRQVARAADEPDDATNHGAAARRATCRSPLHESRISASPRAKNTSAPQRDIKCGCPALWERGLCMSRFASVGCVAITRQDAGAAGPADRCPRTVRSRQRSWARRRRRRLAHRRYFSSGTRRGIRDQTVCEALPSPASRSMAALASWRWRSLMCGATVRRAA